MSLALVLSVLATPLAPGTFELEARPIEWGELSPRHFDLRWQLPERPREGTRDLVGEMERLTLLRFDVVDADGTPLRTLGDLVVAAGDRSPRVRRAWFDGLAQRAPRLFADWGAGLEQLLFDEGLFSESWKPEKDLADDGLLTTEEGWSLAAEGAPWNALDVRPRVEQAAALLRADLASVKAAENDYRLYPDDVAAKYEAIYPVRGSYMRGTDDVGNDFASLTVFVCSDLPFPYSSYECRVRQLHRLDAAGRPVTDIYSTSSDFHWLAGKDVFLPVETSDGRRVAWLVVRLYGFDIDGVPDKPRHRRIALRSSLGNLKRRAEVLAARGEPAAPVSGAPSIPPFRVFGVR